MVSSHADLVVPAMAGATGVGHSKGSHQLRFEERAERLPWAFRSSLSLRLWTDSGKSICQGERSGEPSLHAPTLADSKAWLQHRYRRQRLRPRPLFYFINAIGGDYGGGLGLPFL